MHHALLAFTLWGLLPIYLKQIPNVPSIELTAYRVLLSLLTLFLAFNFYDRNFLKKALSHLKKPLLWIAAFLIGINWFLFVYAVENNAVLQASFGYFCGPLMSLCLARFILKEKLIRLQYIAVFFMICAILAQAFSFNSFPWISLFLGSSFSLYGFVKKKVRLPALHSLFIESLILSFVAIYFAVDTDFSVTKISLTQNLFLIGTGIVTIMPLYFFSKAAKSITLSQLGFIQYLAPSLQFITGYFLYNETLTQTKLISFILVWIACLMIIFSYKLKK